MRARERRIEQVVAVVASALVLTLFLVTSGIGLFEGIAVYAGVGAAIFFLARRTFFSSEGFFAATRLACSAPARGALR